MPKTETTCCNCHKSTFKWAYQLRKFKRSFCSMKCLSVTRSKTLIERGVFNEKLANGFKRCRKCKKVKTTLEFHKDASKSDGIYSSCKMCRYLLYPHKMKRNYDNPLCTKGYKIKNGKRLHREIMQRILKRKLKRDECVHHINGNKLDNRPSNLEIISRSEHSTHHLIERWSAIPRKTNRVTCQYCGKSRAYSKNCSVNVNNYRCRECSAIYITHRMSDNKQKVSYNIID